MPHDSNCSQGQISQHDILYLSIYLNIKSSINIFTFYDIKYNAILLKRRNKHCIRIDNENSD